MKVETAKRLHDAVDACEQIAGIVDGRTMESLAQDRVLRAALERFFEILGEALNIESRTDPDVAARIPDLRSFVGMRNRLAHGYDKVDHIIVWQVAVDEIPETRTLLDRLLGDPIDNT